MERTSARFALCLGLFALFAVLVHAGCDSGGGEGALAPGTFEAVVASDEDEERLEGTATFSLSGEDGAGPLFSLRLSTGTFSLPERPPLPDSLTLPDSLLAPDQIETGLFLDAFRESVPPPGTYDARAGGGAFGAFGVLRANLFGLTLLVPYRADAGTVTVTEASAERVSGTFALTGSGAGLFSEGDAEEVEITGRFAALAE